MAFFEAGKLNKIVKKVNLNKIRVLHPAQEMKINRELAAKGLKTKMGNLNTPSAIKKFSIDMPGEIAKKEINFKVSDARIFKDNPYLKLIPQDAFVKQGNRAEIKARMEEVKVTLKGLAARGVKVPDRIWKDIEMLTDSSKRITVINAYASLASIYGYVAFRVVGAVAVLGIPNTDAASTILNACAATALLAGEGLVRIPTTIGFQHVILRALDRGPEYYRVGKTEKEIKTEKLKAAGMNFDPAKNVPFELYKDSPENLTVIYISREENVLLRSLYGHFLIENKRQKMAVAINSPKFEKDYRGNAAEVEGWVKGMLESVLAAKVKMAGQSVDEAKNELEKVLSGIKASYEKQGNRWLAMAREKTKNRRQGKAPALDDYLGMQLLMHAKKWQEKIDALDKKSKKLSEEEMKTYIDSFYQYLEHRFTYNIILNFRHAAKTVDIDLFKEMLNGVSQELVKLGIDMGAPVNADILKQIAKAVEDGNKAVKKPLSASFKQIRDRINGEGKPDEKIDAYIERLVTGGVKTGDALANILMEQVSRTPYRGGIKAGSRGDVFSRFGKSFVKTKTLFGSEIEMEAEDWDGKAKEIGCFKETSRISWPKADFVGSFDKDYVPLSIDPYTGEYVDIFRNNTPMFKKWSKEEGRGNIALVQNLQINANYQEEGLLDENGNRMFIEEPLEPVAKGSESDQQPWYGAHVLAKVLDDDLNSYTEKGRTGKDFLKYATKKLYTQFGLITRFSLIKDEDKAQKLENEILSEMGEERLSRYIDRTTGTEIIERIKKHAKDKVITTGIGPGRGHFGGMFSCGTCELEYAPGMILGFNRPYVQTVDGKTLAQADIRFNPETGRMEIFNYENRYSRYGKNGADESFYVEKLNQHKLSAEEIKYAAEQYPDKVIKMVGDRIHILNKDTGALEKVIWFYDQNPDIEHIKSCYEGWKFKIEKDKMEVQHPNPKKQDENRTYYFYPETSWGKGMFKNCRKVEVDYSKYDTEKTVIRDYASDGGYYEIKLVKGRIKQEVVYATQKNVKEVMAGLYATREIEGEPDVSVNPEDLNEVIIKINVNLPEIEARFHGADGKYSEKVLTPPVYQPDKWLTEDMATTYWHMLTGWQTEIQPVEAGRAEGPSAFTDMALMHRRWFKGGPEVEKDFQEELKANGIKTAVDGIPVLGMTRIGRTPAAWLINQAKKWPMHTLTDRLLYGVPAAYWVGLYALPKGLNPLSTPEMYIPLFGVYLWLTLGMYIRPMGQLRNSYKDIWYKEALLRMLAPAYVDAHNLAKHRQPLLWDATEAGERKILPLNYLGGIAWRRELSRGTALFGLFYTAGLTATLGTNNISAPVAAYAGLTFNWAFPLLNTRLFDTGIKRFYGFWTSFDELAIYNCQLAGIELKGITVNGKKEKTIMVEKATDDPGQRIITVMVKNTEQAEKAAKCVTGATFGSYLAKSANNTLGEVMKVIRGWRRDENRRFKENFAQFNDESNGAYAGFLGAKSVKKLPKEVRAKYVTYLEMDGKLKRVNNVIFHVNDSARLVSEPGKPENTDQGMRVKFRVKINDKAEDFKYENYDKRVWVDGNYYFPRDIGLQLPTLLRSYKEKFMKIIHGEKKEQKEKK